MWNAYFKMDFLDKDPQPTFKVNDIYDSQMLNNNKDHIVQRNYIYLRKNDLQLEDDFIQLYYTGEATYYDVGKQYLRPLSKVNDEDKDLLYRNKLY